MCMIPARDTISAVEKCFTGSRPAGGVTRHQPCSVGVVVLGCEPGLAHIIRDIVHSSIRIVPPRSLEPVDVVIIDESAGDVAGLLAALKLRNQGVAEVGISSRRTLADTTAFTVVEPLAPARLIAIVTLAAANIREIRAERRQGMRRQEVQSAAIGISSS